MGYKLAGCDVLGGVEIDPRMSALYVANHKPKHEYVEGVQDFCARPDASLPSELFELDVLDGSPPCSTFSMAGSREGKWGKATHFREGQAVQVLDDLFGQFLLVAAKLQPKVVIAENVKGMLAGNAKGYVREVLAGFKAMGYEPQLFLVDASCAGVPQKRERVVFVARRNDLGLKPLQLSLDEAPIGLKSAGASPHQGGGKQLGQSVLRAWHAVKPGRLLKDARPDGSLYTVRRSSPDLPAYTVTATASLLHWSEPRTLTSGEVVRASTFPDDYDFLDEDATYVCGMSVPPFLMQRVALAIREQWTG